MRTAFANPSSRAPGARRSAFTLIELLVVVAIIALLISILLPALGHAKEQARIANCIANERSIAQAAVTYIMDNRDLVFAFPWDYHVNGEEVGFNLATHFVWSGGVPDKRRGEWDFTQGSFNPVGRRTDVYMLSPGQRPLNWYLDPGMTWDDPERVKGSDLRYQRSMVLPAYFICPSDKTAAVPEMGRPDDPSDMDTPFSSWEWWGTSYPVNWGWAYYYDAMGWEPVGNTTNPGCLTGSPHKQMLRSKQERGASEWVLFGENRLGWALESARPRGANPDQPRLFVGWHGQQDMHAAGFFDGHAEYRSFDTRFVEGAGWSIWPNHPWTDTPWGEFENN